MVGSTNQNNPIPTNYRISVLGFLDENTNDLFGGLVIEVEEPDQDGCKSVVTLTGQFVDQAALFGVLQTLYNIHLPPLEVEYLGKQK